MTFCPVFWGISPWAISLIGRAILVTRAALFTSQQMVILTMKKGFFPETQIKLLWKFREVWPSLMRRSGPLPPSQALTFHLIKPRFRDFCPSSQEGLRQKGERTSSTSTFQHFQNHSNPKALRYFLSLGNNIPAIYFMIKISEYESFQNLKKDTDLNTVEWFPKCRPMYWVGALHPRSRKTLDHISVLTCKKPELWVPGEL